MGQVLLPLKMQMAGSYAELKKALEEHQKRLQALAVKRMAVLADLEKIDTEIEQISGMSVQAALESLNDAYLDKEIEAQKVIQELSELDASRTVQKGSLTDHIIQVLKTNRHGMKPREITDKVVERGYKSNAANLLNNVNAALHKIRGRGEIKFDKKTKLYFPKN